jgi:hypothetical protein
LERILSRKNLLQAWKRVKANGGAPGLDGMTVRAFQAPTVIGLFLQCFDRTGNGFFGIRRAGGEHQCRNSKQ